HRKGHAHPDAPANDEHRGTRPRLPPELRAQQAAGSEDRLRAVELVWLWRDEWLAGLQALDGVTGPNQFDDLKQNRPALIAGRFMLVSAIQKGVRLTA